MTLVRLSGPAAEPVTAAGLKAQLRLTHDSEDALLNALIKAAREEVERATGAALIDQSWRLTLDDWPDEAVVTISRFPVKAISAVTVYGADGAPAVLDPGDYFLDARSRPARLWFHRRPAPHRAMNGIEIDFTAGFGEAGPDASGMLCRAILMLAAHWYEFRASYGPNDQPVSYPPGFERLVAGFRTVRL